MPDSERDNTAQALREAVEKMQREYTRALQQFHTAEGAARCQLALDAYTQAVRRYSDFTLRKVVPLKRPKSS